MISGMADVTELMEKIREKDALIKKLQDKIKYLEEHLIEVYNEDEGNNE